MENSQLICANSQKLHEKNLQRETVLRMSHEFLKICIFFMKKTTSGNGPVRYARHKEEARQ